MKKSFKQVLKFKPAQIWATIEEKKNANLAKKIIWGGNSLHDI